MLEGLAAWILNTYVGEYFENLNTDQLSVGLLQGAVELENLPLKKDALNHLGYPLGIRAGHIGKIKLQIPVYRLRSEPWVIFIEKLLIVVGPVQSFSYNENEEETAALKRKLTRLEAKDVERKAAQNEKQQSTSYMYTNWKSYSTSVFASVAENLQLNIRDVHIRYEDDLCIPGRSFACGIIIRGLAAQSTDEKWAPQFIEQSTSEMMWKLIQLDGLSVYWDTNAIMIGHLETELMKSSMIKHMETCVLPDTSTKDHEYVLASVDATARFKRNCSQQALRSHSTPRIVCDIQFEKIPLFFSKSQYRLILEWEKGFNSLHTKWSNRKWRPTTPIISSAKAWWDYAISVHLEPLRLRKKTRTWSFVLQRAKDLNEYTKVYHEYLKNPECLSSEFSDVKEDLETKLGYNELCYLRDLVIDRIQKEKIASGLGEKEPVGQGFLQWLFPRWVGWYAAPVTDTITEQTCYENEEAESMEMKAKLEEEILGVLDTTADDSLLKRDAIFAQMNFCLVQGTFVLLDDVEHVRQDQNSGRYGKTLVELEFSDVLTRFETRPRTSSALFEIKLGALYIHDRMFTNSCFPHLIAPQSRDTYYVSSGSMLFQFPSSIVEENEKKNGDRHLFELLYEKNPLNRRYDHKLVVKTKSLDVIFNSELITVITNFFTLPPSSSDRSLLSAASAQYEILKQQTKAELQQTWDKMIVGERKHKRRWFIELDISAPQIIIPENIFDANTSVVVFDLGELHILNSAKAGISTSNSCDFDDEDDFHTPCSTPKELLSQSESASTLRSLSLDSEQIDEAHFLYECYTLELKNMQVLVSSLKDSWKFAQLRGSSSLHILNRFSVNIQAHRRTVMIEDSQYPSLAFVASLPKLTLHISEHKISALKSCIRNLSNQFNGSSENSTQISKPTDLPKLDDFENKLNEENAEDAGRSVFLLLQFCVDQMTFDIESRSQSVAELQVSGLKTSLSKCGNETSLMLCVHSLLVVDALQTYGPDFELLVASHKRVSMDNSSGKLQNTDPSDTSDFFTPPSPSVPCSPRAESPMQWSTFEKQLREQSFGDALIFFEFKITKPPENSEEEELQVASVHFNNLDVIANQETIIEIVGLFRRLTQDSDHKSSIPADIARSGSVSEFEFPSVKSSKKIDITFNFHRLNILLLRAMSHSSAGQKLATATLSGTQIKAEIGSYIKICGTLGGLQVLDLVTESTKFQKIVSLGIIPTQHSYTLFNESEQTSDSFLSSADSQEAFSFTVVKRDGVRKSDHLSGGQEDICELDVTVRMASLCYSHSPRLLYELTCCASEFKSYLRSVAHSIRTAAAEVAKGIVSKRYDSPSFSIVDDNKFPLLKNQNEGFSPSPALRNYYSQEDHVSITFRIDVFLKSPVVILPCSSTHPEVFLAHLGHIAVYNKLCHRFPLNHPFLYSIEEIKDDSLFLEVNGMNMFFVNVDTELNSNSSDNCLDFSIFEASNDSAILHDTTLEIFIIPMKELVPTFYPPSANSTTSIDAAETADIMQNQFTVRGDVTPLKVVFTKHQYRKMFELLDNLTYTSYSSPDVSSCTTPSTKISKCLTLSQSNLSTNVATVFPAETSPQFPKNRSFLVLAKFELPSFTVELRDDLNVKESLVSLTFQEFTLSYENKNSFETLIQATLSALLMEDLRDAAGSNQPCVLMSSKQNTTTQGSVFTHSSRFISTSCPNISEFYPQLQWGFSASLPNYLCTENMFQLQNDYRMKAAMKTHCKRQLTKSLNTSCPNTPPPSPSASVVPSPEPGNTLVNVKVLLVDEQSPYFATKHKKTHLSASIDLNCLDVILNLHSWILVFEFFDSVSNSPSKENANQTVQRRRTFSNEGCSCPGNVPSNTPYNSELEIKVRSLVVTLSKPEYELASANVTHFSSQISKREDSFSLKGKLGGISVSDLTPFGHMYPERFVTTGPEAMHFNIFRHAKYSSRLHHSASDIHVEVQMSSVMYVHTQRFVTDIITFLQYFHQKQCFVAGTQFETSECPVHDSPLYASRIKLNILADTPILVIPQNSSSTEVFVVSLGMLTVNNKIIGGGLLDVTECPHPADSGLCVIPSLSLDQSNRTHKAPIPTLQAGMIFQKVNRALSIDEFCMLDIINIEIKDADVYSAVHTNFLNKRERRRSSASKGSIRGRELVFPSYVLQKQVPLLKEKVTFKIQVERNIDVGISHKVPDFKICGMLSSVHVTLDLEQYKVFRGIIGQNLGEALEEYVYDPCKEVGQFVLMDTNSEVWTTLAFHIDLVNVTLELHDCAVAGGEAKNAPLAKFDFINSRFSYETLSDNAKDIDFVSNEIRITDIREQVNISPNVFRTILAPTKQGSSGDSVLQAELHYRLMHDLTKMTVLLNNMRVMGILDFLQSTLQFLTCPLPDDDSCSKSFPEIESLQEPNAAAEQKLVMEIKVNVSNTEFVLAEDTSQLDSSAVFLKSTAVIFWKPDNVEKPLSCSLQSLEMFSCILGIEDDTALSIIDPVNLVVELLNKPSSPIANLESTEDVSYSLEISAANLYIRLSYNDLLLFFKILESVKKQTGMTISGSSSPAKDKTSENAVQRLAALGFTTNDCLKALASCDGNLNDAALWLTYHAFPAMDTVSDNSPTELSDGSESGWRNLKLNSIELRIDSVGLCIIDDCRNADVPILEICLSDFDIFQKMNGGHEGHGLFIFSTDYYNCSVSGWEPLMEPWRCKTKWSLFQALSKPSKKYILNVSSDDSVNVNITSSFLNLYKSVKKNWSEDYLSGNFKTDTSHRRSQFVPFALKNNTGCKLWFATQIIESEKFYVSQELIESRKRTKETSLVWKQVAADEISEVRFESRMKLRHKDSHQMKLHQIIVRVDGWETITPVSVDRVGIYFRCARPETGPFTAMRSNSFQGRVLFSVVLENSARKLITVQSALSVINKLDDTLEMKLEYPVAYHGAKQQNLFIVPNEEFPIPLPFVHAQIWVRPINHPVTYSDLPIFWQHVTQPGEIEASIKTCKSTFRPSNNYQFCVCVKRGNFPEAKPEIDSSKTKRLKSSSTSSQPLPGHRLVFLPCLEVTNLLPYEMNYFMDELKISGCIKPGKAASLYNIDITNKFLFGISIDNFKRCKKISISATSRHYPSRLELYDSQDRVVLLQLKVLSLAGGALKVYISAPYWLINKTGLPLVFKQEGTQIESAGQFEEHEMARSMAPLLFSFSDTEASNMCSMRIGKSLHPRGISIWCARFHLEKGVRVRRLHVGRNDSRPDWVYIIGIEVNVGKGRYKDTNIVTLSPRYYLDNRSRHTLEFCQKFALKETSQYILSAVPNCSLPFHWPRIDLDNMLCIRIVDAACKWSGGFAIDGNKSFHINMRNGDGVSQFLQTEITLHGATYYVIFSDADNLPPPIRIDNHSEVSVTYYQTNVTEERLKTAVRPRSSVSYAWDEPMLPPYITCSAPGGSVATYNMNVFREGNQLFYENFIYIAFSGTFLRSEPKIYPSKKSEAFPEGLLGLTVQELVLDVPYGTAVVLSRKAAGKRSQLWRMTSSGMLQHEGSTPPVDLHKPQSSSINAQKLVLDIAGLGAQPQVQIPLMLRKPDPRRQHTQTWKFTTDGRLCCSHPNMYVQAKDGYQGLRAGNDAVLGPQMPCAFVTMENGVPVEQAICRQKLRGGSGVLSVKVVPDGPTRVLQITDLKQKVNFMQTSEADDFVVVPSTSSNTECFSLENSNKKKSLFGIQFILKLPNGLGISIVNYLNEELIYVTLQDINIEFSKSASALSFDGSFRDIQVDNQIREAEKSVVLFVTPASKTDNQRHLPAMHFTLHRIETSLVNADIFKHLIITIKNLTAHLEERLLMKLLQFFGFDQGSDEMERFNENNNEIQSSLFHHVKNDRRYYFSTLKLSLQQLRLSVHSTDHLPADLRRIKHKIGLRLVQFEDAVVELDPYVKVHPFETAKCLIESIVDHYKEELKGQAAKILGAVDFLGNPLGLVNDVTDGLSELIHDGNVGGLIKNVAHGLSNTAAKLSESLSDGLGLVAIDEKHQKMRKQIRQGGGASAGNDHLMAGIRGLGIGIFGGVTSLITQTYEGAAQEGVQGFFSGFGKGLVGTVAKPAVGFLDLASGAASAVRDTSKRNSHVSKARMRPPRIYVGPGGLLSRYYLQQALGQELLYNLNNQNYSELFIAKEVIRSEGEDVQVLISSERVYVMSSGSSSLSNVMLQVEFEDLYHCCYVCSHVGAVSESRHYLQLFIKDNSSASSPSSDLNNYPLFSSDERVCKKPKVRCDSKEVTEKVVMQISYAKSLYEERISMLPVDEDSDNPFGSVL